MADVHTIAVIPTKAGAGLLVVGPCGARVPRVWAFCEDTRLWELDPRWYVGGPGKSAVPSRNALVLVYDGVPLEQGMSRALRVLWGDEWLYRGQAAEPLAVARRLVGEGRVSFIVFLDVDGREVTP